MSLFGRKPGTLGEVVRRVKAGEQRFDPALREFLDSFYVNTDSRQQAIEEQPHSIDAVHDAYVAAVAEHLAHPSNAQLPRGQDRVRAVAGIPVASDEKWLGREQFVDSLSCRRRSARCAG